MNSRQHLPTLPWRGLWKHLTLTLRLNFRSRAPLIYGYLVPVFFLLAFGSVFRSTTPPLLHEMGQLLTITILGGACFGMPTAVVAERERGVWRRYRLLPFSSVGLLLSTTLARLVLVGSAAVMQIVLAWAIYRTPWPAHPAQFAGAFLAVVFAFLGLGWIIAMLADNVPAVQALGQAVFLPMIMIGGVGVPLRTLPPWAQRVADFLPGRYAVEALDACLLPEGGGLARAGWALAALAIIGAAAFAAAAGLFRWEGGPRPLRGRSWAWLALALMAWVGVGLTTETRSHPKVPANVAHPIATVAALATPVALPAWHQLTEADLARLRFDDLPPDDGYITPLAAGYDGLEGEDKTRLDHLQDQLAYWQPGTAAVGDAEQRVRNLLSVCAVADLVMDRNEAEIARAVFEQIKDAVRDPLELQQILAWIALHPEGGAVRLDVTEFGIGRGSTEPFVRDRVSIYAKKLLRELRSHPPTTR